jgi:phospholipase/carboxylesterase
MTLIHAVAHPGAQGTECTSDRLPTLIALHGYGANGQDLLGLSPYLAGGHLLMICPQAPLLIEPGFPGFSWYPFSGPAGQADETAIEDAITLVCEFIDFALDAYPVQHDRVALLGFSQGGGMAYRVGFRYPQRFVGLAALSTRLPEDVFADGPPQPSVLNLPLLIQHGASDPTVAIDGGRSSRERLEALGLQPDYREYPMGHEVSGSSAQELSTWLKQVLGFETED